MNDDILTASTAVRRRGPGGRTLAALIAAALLLGALGSAWLGWYMGWLSVDFGWGDEPQSAMAPAIPVTPAARVVAIDPGKVAELETRLAEVDREAAAASGQASRAEGLLIAFAARRAIERGQPLGYLENQLRVRFHGSQPASVERIVKAANEPITLDLLSEQLALIEGDLTRSGPQENSWEWVQRQASELFIIRHADSPSPAPQKRLARARQFLAGGRVEAAMDEISRMPGREAAADWLAKAQSWVTTQRALDIIEAAALLQPGTPAPAPATTAVPAPAPQ